MIKEKLVKNTIYLLGYILVSFVVSKIIGNNDPEPIGAEVSLLIFGVVSALISLIAQLYISRLYSTSYSISVCFFNGLFSALIFYGILTLSNLIISSLGLSFLLALMLTLLTNALVVYVKQSNA